MSKLKGFFSYVHADNEAEGDRITQLARDVKWQFEMLTGDGLDLFLDRDEIEWGEHWREKLESSLESTAFFIPVLTPRYLLSAECRAELQFFLKRVGQLVLPILYVDVAAIRDSTPDVKDDLVLSLRGLQHEDWRDVRFSERSAEPYRRAIGRLAQRIVDSNTSLEKFPKSDSGDQEEASVPSGESGGFLDLAASTEKTIPRLQKTLTALSAEIEEIGKTMGAAVAELTRNESSNGGFTGRVRVARKLARTLEKRVERFYAFGTTFASQIHDIDRGFTPIIERSGRELIQRPDLKREVCESFEQIRRFSAAASAAVGEAERFATTLQPLEDLSRDLRPVVRRLREGLAVIVETREVIGNWVYVIAGTGVDCSDLERKG